ncbi:MAG: hypothetical protein R2867_05890 [Caldilineaceae bacterium]
MADGRTDADYAAVMVDAAQQALSYLPVDDSHRRELAQWVAEGLQVTLAAAQQREDWGAALSTLEQLAGLPPDLVDRAILERTQRSVTVRQALQLLETENRSAALELAGGDLLDPSVAAALRRTNTL